MVAVEFAITALAVGAFIDWRAGFLDWIPLTCGPEPTLPSEVLFTQSSISGRVTHNGSTTRLEQLVDAVRAGDPVRPIRIVYHQGKWMSIDNRRLFAFQLYEQITGRAPIQPWFKVWPKTGEFWDKYTNDRCGVSIKVARTFFWNYNTSDQEDVLEMLESLQ